MRLNTSATLARVDPSAIERGNAIASSGIPSQRVPKCVKCHGPSPTRRNPAYPMLAGQHADYLVLQIELLKKDQRGGSRYARLMRPIAGRLTSEQMRDVATYYASLPATLAGVRTIESATRRRDQRRSSKGLATQTVP